MVDFATVAAASKTAATVNSTAASATKGIADNFDQFLQLLTTQLKNQNPLDPLDTNQFTQQLVQFAGVEQQLKTNDTLGKLITSTNRSSAISSALGFVGATVTYDSSTTQLAGGKAAWNVNSALPASATLDILDANGTVVRSFGNVTLRAGDNPFTWNGRLESGQLAADGSYTLRVTAKNARNEAVSTSIESSGLVDSADVTSETPMLRIGSESIPVGKVKSIRRS